MIRRFLRFAWCAAAFLAPLSPATVPADGVAAAPASKVRSEPPFTRTWPPSASGFPTSAPTAGDDGTWLRMPVPEGADAPAIYDTLRQRTLVLGGVRDNFVFYEDLPVWEYTMPGGSFEKRIWRRLHPAGTPPKNRILHAAVYDSFNDRIVVYGGLEFDTNLSIGDVWALEDLGGTPTWVQLGPTGGPPPTRYGSAAVYDPSGSRMIVYGGYTDDVGGDVLDDLWALSLDASPAWTPLTDTGALPGWRVGPAHAYDPAHGRLVLHAGGIDGDVYFLDLAALVWTKPTVSGTPPVSVQFHAAVYDPLRQRLVLTGADGAENLEILALSLGDEPSWTALAPLDWYGLEPSARIEHAAIYDPVNDRMLLFGGSGIDFTILGDAWFYDPDHLGVEQWIPAAPVPRRGGAVAYDAGRRRLWLFGGRTFAGYLADLWALELSGGGQWTHVQSMTPSPPARAQHTLLYDPESEALVCFGGENGSVLDDVWALADLGNPEAPSWAPLSPIGTPPNLQVGHTAVYDAPRRRMVVFGRRDPGPENGVWALHLGLVPAWSVLQTIGTGPSGRTHAASIYDPASETMIVFGGGDPATNDAFRLSLSGQPTWTSLATTGLPPDPRRGHTMVYDSNRQRALVFAGEQAGTLSDQLHALDLTASPAPWSQLATDCDPTFCERPNARVGHGAVYDPVFDRMIAVGGEVGPLGSGKLASDAWSVAFGTVVSADVAPVVTFTLGPPVPNPSRGAMRFDLVVPRSASAEIALYDAAGRRVHSLHAGPIEAGQHRFHWDGRGSRGVAAAAGIYFLRTRVAGEEQVRKVVVAP